MSSVNDLIMAALNDPANPLSVGDLLFEFWQGQGYNDAQGGVSEPTGRELMTWLEGEGATGNDLTSLIRDYFENVYAGGTFDFSTYQFPFELL